MTAHDPRVTLTEAEVDRLVFEFGDHTNIYALTDMMADLIAARLAPIRAPTVVDFAQWVATNRAYNGSDHPHGQSLYNECLNGVLPLWALQYARNALDAPQDAPRGPVGGEQPCRMCLRAECRGGCF